MSAIRELYEAHVRVWSRLIRWLIDLFRISVPCQHEYRLFRTVDRMVSVKCIRCGDRL